MAILGKEDQSCVDGKIDHKYDGETEIRMFFKTQLILWMFQTACR